MGPIRSLWLAASMLVARAAGQTLLDANSLPACAMTCGRLSMANAGCIPPAALVSNQATYQSCFCQSAFISTLYSSPAGICDAECPAAADQSRIQQWYIAVCRPQAANPTTVVVVGGQTTLATSATSRSTATSGSSSSNGAVGSQQQGSWISTHWKWILLLIVVFAAMLGFGFLGVTIRRRHDRKRDLARANVAATSGGGSSSAPAPGSNGAPSPAGILASGSYSSTHLNPNHRGAGGRLPEMTHADRSRGGNSAPLPAPPVPYPQSTRPRPPVIPAAAMSRSMAHANSGNSPVSPISQNERATGPHSASVAAAQAALGSKGKYRLPEPAVREVERLR